MPLASWQFQTECQILPGRQSLACAAGTPVGNLYIDGMAAQSISEQHFKFTLEEKTAFSKKCWDLFKKDPEHPYLVKFWRPNIDSYRKYPTASGMSRSLGTSV